ncbi:1998_t:CDS:2, partial [Acaulospora colombiana]
EHWQIAEKTIDYLNLIFDATLDETNVLAKVLLRPYGKEVHVHLAARDMAPHLYGISTVHGFVHQRLEEILECLEAEGMVHGDFRMANIMLKIGEEEKAMLIDFDWAGRGGEVKYPITRSDGLKYPGEPGGPISAGDDCLLFEKWRMSLPAFSPPVMTERLPLPNFREDN